MRSVKLWLWLGLGAAFWSVPVQVSAEFRVALLVGHNQGDHTVKPLRFAESDARRLAQLLKELGGLQVLPDPSPTEPFPKHIASENEEDLSTTSTSRWQRNFLVLLFGSRPAERIFARQRSHRIQGDCPFCEATPRQSSFDDRGQLL